VEDLLIVLIQFLIEVIGQALISIPFDCACRVRDKPERNAVLISALFLVVGGAVGWISLAFVPGLVRNPALRVATLFLSPVLAGVFGYYIARWQSRSRNPLLVPRYHFWYAFSFTLGLAAVRFAYSKHAAAI
jgi:hypothetical protein